MHQRRCLFDSHLLLVLLLSTLLLGTAHQSQAQLTFSTVILDAGHGGKDKGRITDQYFEKHYTLDVAVRVKALLEKENLKVVMTRTRDRTVSLEDRALEANLWARSIFVSIHFNAHSNPRYRGIETFYLSPSGKTLAAAIQRSLIRRTGTKNRGIKTANFYVLRETRMPAALVEGGFMSNPTDLALILNPAYRQKIAEAIVEGILLVRDTG